METEHLKEFLVMARLRNYTAASEEMFMSQSSVFKHIRALEKELGADLFKREGKQISLTEFGFMFINHAEAMLSHIDSFREEVRIAREAEANVLKLVDEYPNFDLSIDFHKAYPQYSVRQICPASAEEAINSDAELFLIRGEPKEFNDKYEWVKLTEDSIVLVTSLDHPLAGRDSVSLSDLKNENFIGFSNPDISYDRRRAIFDEYSQERLCRNAGINPNIVMSTFPGSEVARLVAQGAGVALLRKNSIMRRLGNQVAYVNLDPEIRFPIRFYYRKEKPLSQVAKDYINYALSWHETYK